MRQTVFKGRLQHRVGVALVAIPVLLLANWLLLRVEEQHLFLLSLPVDRAPSELELLDATMSAREWRVPALIFLSCLGVLVLCFPLRIGQFTTFRPFESQISLRAPCTWIGLLLIVATLADLVTTCWFVHTRSISLEIHPGIRLFAYAFGRTTGIVLAKLLQLAGIIIFGACFPRWKCASAFLAACLMLFAAAHNVLHMVLRLD